MNEMTERVARVLAKSEGRLSDDCVEGWENCTFSVVESCRDRAKLVIAAMRQPTKEMADAIMLQHRPVGRAEYIAQYRNMIDAA